MTIHPIHPGDVQDANRAETMGRVVPFPVERARAHFGRAVIALAEQPTRRNVVRYLVASRALDAAREADGDGG